MSARILIVDLENSSATGEFWGKPYQTNIIRITKPSSVISFAAKWLGEKMQFYSDFHDGHDVMIQKAWELLDEADAVVTYNGDKHDIPHFNREFDLAGLGAPAPYISTDLYKVSKKMSWQSHKLDFILQQLGEGAKLQHSGYDLWVRCAEGDPAAWAVMRRYNIRDVELTEQLYKRWLPWIPGSKHPNLQLFGASPDECPKCGTGAFVKNGVRPTQVGLFQRWKCVECGSSLTGGKSLERTEVRAV